MTSNDIRELRKSLGMSRQQFADKLNTTSTTVYRWETGKVTPIPMAMTALNQLKQEAQNAT